MFNGFGLLSSHLAEDYGREIHEETLVQRDNAWLSASDAYVAVLPWGTDEPIRSDGTFIEIGLALGLGVPCVLLIERGDDPRWSYYVRNLRSEEEVLVLPLEADDAKIMDAVKDYLAHPRWVTDRPNSRKALNIGVIHALATGGKAGHTVNAGSRSLDAPAGALSSRYCAALRRLFQILEEVAGGRSVLELGNGVGESTARLVAGGALVAAFEPDPSLREACSGNVPDPGNAALRWIALDSVGTAAASADLIVVQFPPWPDAVDPFADRREQLLRALRKAVLCCPAGTPVWISVCSATNSDLAVTALATLGIDFSRVRVEDRSVGVLLGTKA